MEILQLKGMYDVWIETEFILKSEFRLHVGLLKYLKRLKPTFHH